MIVKLLTKHRLEFLSLKGGCSGSSESTLAKMSYCWKSHATAHLITLIGNYKGLSNVGADWHVVLITLYLITFSSNYKVFVMLVLIGM